MEPFQINVPSDISEYSNTKERIDIDATKN